MDLETEIPDAETLLSIAPEELAPIILKIMNARISNGIVHPGNVFTRMQGSGMSAHPTALYGGVRAEDVELAIGEALLWLEINLIIIPAAEPNGSNGFKRLSRKGRELLDTQKFISYRAGAAFPKSLLHPSIAFKAWLDITRGQLADAVFFSFRTVEEAVRAAGKFQPTDIGTALMNKAFGRGGPLVDPNQPEAEQDGLRSLFVGAIGSYKNPHSHRTVTLSDPLEAQEMVLLASHLLRIVDARREYQNQSQHR